MSHDDISQLLTGGDFATPFTVHTTGGRSYEVTDPAHVWLPPGVPGVVAIAVPRKTLAIVRLDSIDSITLEESEAAAEGRK